MRTRLLLATVTASLALTSCSLLPSPGSLLTRAGPEPPPAPAVEGLRTEAAEGTRLKPTKKGPLSGTVVVVDAGHAGRWSAEKSGKLRTTFGDKLVPCYTTGATAPDGTPEHALNHDLALRTADALRARGATVVLTRADDTTFGPCNDARGKAATKEKAHLLLSLHADSDAAHRRGFHLIHSPSMRGGAPLQDRSLAAARAVAAALRGSPLPPANYKGTPDDPTDARTNMAILNELSTTPGLLVEVGNLNNPDDWALLARARTRDQLAAALAKGAEKALTGRA